MVTIFARANRKVYFGILRGDEKIPTLTEYQAANTNPDYANKKQIVKFWKLNELAFEDIILSINADTRQGKTAFHLVDNCVTKDQPHGNSRLAWERLVNEFLPKTAPSYIKLKKEFANSDLGGVDNRPDEWMTNLESMRSQMNAININNKTNMSEVDLIIHILSNLPEEYEVAIAELEKELQDTSKTLDIEEVRRVLNSRYERIKKNKEINLEEKAYAAFIKQFKGTCRKCGEYGHKAQDCPKGNKHQSQQATGADSVLCYYCGEPGHYAINCPIKKKAKDARNGNDQANFAIEEEAYESCDDGTEIGF